VSFLASRHLPVVVEISPWSHLGHAVHTVCQEPDQPIPSDRPALLLVHGFGAVHGPLAIQHSLCCPAAIRSTRSICSALVVVPSPPAFQYGGALWRDQLVAYVHERIGRPTVIAGNSLGGFAALAAGAALGEDCAGVVLLNAAGPLQ
jgi:pimeloyl-ACP methyl ester carboxylesterase